MPEELVISDASPLIALVAIGRVDLLRKMYQRVLIMDVVKGEIHAELPEWIEVSTDYEVHIHSGQVVPVIPELFCQL